MQYTFNSTQAIIAWQKKYGRHHLPWQNTSPYATWISEIMLQQTQVEKVIPYYHAFMERFPHIKSLAEAPIDSVLALWSGLGYYRRAHNLHKTAQLWYAHYPIQPPQTLEEWMAFPGIGMSTAGAIMSLSLGYNAAICDANVVKVLSRFYGIDLKTLKESAKWDLVRSLLPHDNAQAYNQGLMDIGATLCHKKNPLCHACPLTEHCAHSQGDILSTIPTPRDKAAKKIITLHVGLCIQHNTIALTQRPTIGIWPQLWFLPDVIPDTSEPTMFEHILTHRLLKVSVYLSTADTLPATAHWIDLHTLEHYAQPSLLKKILTTYIP